MTAVLRRAPSPAVPAALPDCAAGKGVVVPFPGCAVAVTSPDRRLVQAVAGLYPDTVPARRWHGPAPQVCFELRRCSGVSDDVELTGGQRPPVSFASAAEAVAYLEYRMTDAVLATLSDHLLVHAAAVATGDAGLVLPGGSGAGKSTLVAALALAGFAYLSDELAIIDRQTCALQPFPKPIRLREGGWQALAATGDLPAPRLEVRDADGRMLRYLAPPQPCPVACQVPIRWLLRPVRQPGAAVSLKRASRARVMAELAGHVLDLPRHGPTGIDLLAQIVADADCYTLTYDRARDAVALIADLTGYRMDDRPGAGTRGQGVSYG